MNLYRPYYTKNFSERTALESRASNQENKKLSANYSTRLNVHAVFPIRFHKYCNPALLQDIFSKFDSLVENNEKLKIKREDKATERHKARNQKRFLLAPTLPSSSKSRSNYPSRVVLHNSGWDKKGNFFILFGEKLVGNNSQRSNQDSWKSQKTKSTDNPKIFAGDQSECEKSTMTTTENQYNVIQDDVAISDDFDLNLSDASSKGLSTQTKTFKKVENDAIKTSTKMKKDSLKDTKLEHFNRNPRANGYRNATKKSVSSDAVFTQQLPHKKADADECTNKFKKQPNYKRSNSETSTGSFVSNTTPRSINPQISLVRSGEKLNGRKSCGKTNEGMGKSYAETTPQFVKHPTAETFSSYQGQLLPPSLRGELKR